MSVTVRELENRLDKLVQTIQRCERATPLGGNWYSTCVTCGRKLPCFGKNCMQGGHFIPRGCKATRWEAANVHPQCPRCNGFLNGAYIEYSRWMHDNFPDVYEWLTDTYELHKKGYAPKLSVIEKRALYNSWLQKGRKLEEMTGQKLFPKKWDYVKM